jgi:hypothetical protein
VHTTQHRDIAEISEGNEFVPAARYTERH